MHRKTEKIIEVLETARSHFVFSAYQLYAERQGQEISVYGGSLSYWPEAKTVTVASRFDIGSITKVVVAASLTAKLYEKKQLKLEDPIGRFIPRLAQTALGRVEIRDCLAHSSGLGDWAPLYQFSGNLEEWFVQWTGEISPRKKSIYSDLGMLLLGLVLQKITGNWESAWQSEVAVPLGLQLGYGPADPSQTAATEYCLIRQRVLHGEVFDENTWWLGGRSVHAGLFSSAQSLAPFAREWLKARRGESGWLKKETALLFTQKSGLVADSTWALGWDTRSPHNSTAGSRFSLSSFGHLGFTGCSLWIDPEASGFAVFFTNRIHPSRGDNRIRDLRPQLHDEIASIW